MGVRKGWMGVVEKGGVGGCTLFLRFRDAERGGWGGVSRGPGGRGRRTLCRVLGGGDEVIIAG